MTTCPTFETSGDDRITPLCDRTMARCPGCRADDAPLPERAGCRDERDDLPNQPRRGPQQMSMCLSWLPRLRSECSHVPGW